MSFPGFPPRALLTALPAQFISRLLPQIQDLAEAKACLYFFWRLGQKRGWPRPVALEEMADLGSGGPPEAELRRGLELAVARGTLLHLALERDGRRQDLYFLNTEADRQALARMAGAPPALPPPAGQALPLEGPRPDIFTLYEQNIGLLTPMLAEELKEAEKLYPPSWLEDAFKEAVDLNKRSWRYIKRILERWAIEGKDSGEPGRHPEAAEKYFRGKYGRIVQR